MLFYSSILRDMIFTFILVWIWSLRCAVALVTALEAEVKLGSLRNNGLMSKLTYSREDLLSLRYNTKAPLSPSCNVPLEMI